MTPDERIAKADLRAEIDAIMTELNDLAAMGARPLWSSFTARLEDMYERLTGSVYERQP